MKPKELLYSLDYVGEDLLAGAEQTVLARKHRPWAGAAAAAVLLVALGVGGFFLWKNLRGGVNPAATGDDPQTVTMPNYDPNAPSTEPDRLTVGDCWTGLNRACFDDLDRSLAGSLAADYEGPTSLPVYERETGPLGDPDHLYTDEQLQARLLRAADVLGLSLTGDVVEGRDDLNGYPDYLKIQTDQGELTASGDGLISLLYNDEYAYEARVKISFSEEMTPEETQRAIRDAQMSECGEELAERLGLGECGFVTCDRWDPASSAWTVFTIYPLREDPAQRLVARWFERVQMLTNDGKTLRGFVLDRLPGEAEDAVGLLSMGDYPIRSEAEAVEALLNGSFLCEEALILNELDGYSPAATLVWLPEAGHELLMPFYRFWFPANANSDEYLAVYVPAIIDACLTDWPADPTTSLWVLDPAEEAAIRALFDPEDPEAIWYLQALTCRYPYAWEMDLAALFRAGIPGVDNTLSQAEREALTALGADPGMLDNCHRLPGKEVDAVLSRFFGLDRELLAEPALLSRFGKWTSFDEVMIDTDSPAYQQALTEALAGLFGDSVYYVPELDCYYDFPQDPNLGPVTILELLRDEQGRVLVTYDASRMPDGRTEPIWTVGLTKEENGYRVLFNLPGEWAVPETYGEPGEAPTEPTDTSPEPTEDPPDPTEAPDGYQPMLVNLEDGQVGVAGPAGTVEALSYMGTPDREPVWADLDGDGFRELIYWCHGPTSGLFTVGLCVYGLEEGWPVLEASQIYSLRAGTVSLSEENGQVWFHHTPNVWTSGSDSPVPGDEQLWPVTLKDGKLVLNGGSLPEGVQEWGGAEYGWFGSSFDKLKAEVKDACTLNHWAALVWTEPSAASAPTAGSNVYAAVTGNSKTVTGLLHYVPQQDGSWICMPRGIEPIEAPADPDSLLGLTMEELAARLGPCHFDMGSGLYIPCWFTEDCRMLTVHIQDVVDYVELKDLAPRPLSEMALEPLDLSTDLGVGLFLLRNDAELVAFYTYFGLFAFDGTSGDLLFAIDLDKTVDRQGSKLIQGSGSVTGCNISEDGKTILVFYYDADTERYADVCVIDVENRTCRNRSSIPSDFTAASLEKLDQEAWGWDDSSRLSDLWILHNGEKWYPFQAN